MKSVNHEVMNIKIKTSTSCDMDQKCHNLGKFHHYQKEPWFLCKNYETLTSTGIKILWIQGYV